jgi:hypothetical protein
MLLLPDLHSLEMNQALAALSWSAGWWPPRCCCCAHPDVASYHDLHDEPSEVASFNGAPNQIMVHFARALQELWFEKIPNRRYIAQPPQVVGERGSFSGESLEETQPVPTEGSSLTLRYCLTAREYRFLVGVASLALLLIASASGLSLMAVLKWPMGALNLTAGAALCFLLALFCLKSSRHGKIRHPHASTGSSCTATSRNRTSTSATSCRTGSRARRRLRMSRT